MKVAILLTVVAFFFAGMLGVFWRAWEEYKERKSEKEKDYFDEDNFHKLK